MARPLVRDSAIVAAVDARSVKRKTLSRAAFSVRLCTLKPRTDS